MRTPSPFNKGGTMQGMQGNVARSLRSVKEFLIENADQLGDIVTSSASTKLDEVIATLETHVAEQAGSHLAFQGSTLKRQALITVLVRDHMAPVARIAQADLPRIPEIDVFRTPRRNLSVERLAAAAYGMAREATPFADHFVKAGLHPDFINRLTAAADAVVHAADDGAQSKGRRTGATKGVRTALQTGRKLVQVLDALISSALASDPALLANWKQVKRVRQPTSRPTSTPAPSPIATPGTPPTPVAGLLSGTGNGQRAVG
jgi:hypothetical protein